MIKDDIESILKTEETADMVPPYRCLPPGHPDWIKIKTKQILDLPHPKLTCTIGEALERDSVWLGAARRFNFDGKSEELTNKIVNSFFRSDGQNIEVKK